MPTYDYRCAKCGDELEVFQTFAEKPLTKHAGCGGKLAKVLSPAGIVLKGSGFYKTDNRNGSKRSGSGDSENGSSKSSENGSSSGSSESSHDSKSSDSGKSDSSKSDSGKSGSEKSGSGSSSSNGSGSGSKPAAKTA
jgi:putative FmdB family regulatory protein